MKTYSNAVTIKKYANRRLYNTAKSTYVTLDDLADLVRNGEEFKVQDARNGEDITHSVLTQIIFDQETKTDQSLLSISFLRQLISLYGGQMQVILPTFLEHSMRAFLDQQAQARVQAGEGDDLPPVSDDEADTTRASRNSSLVREAMAMFSPAGKSKLSSTTDDLAELKAQLRSLQTRLDSLSS